jgi:osmoprotectant transport system substrate-binding protein
MGPRSLVALAVTLPLLLAGCSDSSSDTVKSSSAGEVLVVLPDDLKLQTVDNVTPVVRTSKLTPVVQQALDKVSTTLTTDDLVALNKQVDVDRKSPAQVASAYVEQKSLATGYSGGSGSLVVGAANFGESQILANIYAQALKGAGFTPSVKPVTSREVYEPALEKGQLDVFPEYAGTLTEFLNKRANGKDAAPKASGDLDATITALKALAEPRGLSVLTPSAAADQNAFAVTKKFATANKLTKLSDLKGVKTSLVLGGPAECPTRPFCQPGLEKTYGLKFAAFKSLDAGGPLTKTALRKGEIHVGLVFSSDGSLGTL